MTPDDLWKWRCRYGVTQVEVAEMIGRSRRAWQEWESGETAIPVYLEACLEKAQREMWKWRQIHRSIIG